MKCVHGHEPKVWPEGRGWAGPIMVCECCGEAEGYFFIGHIGPPIGDKDLCAACSPTGAMQIRDLYPEPPPPKTLQERLAAYKASKRS